MRDHPLDWIEAYYDGELSPTQSAEVIDHLEGCAACRQALAGHQRLTNLLRADALPSRLEDSARQAHLVMARLPARQQPWRPRLLRMAWRLAPLLVFSTWAFGQSVLIISAGLLAVAGFIPGGDQILSLLEPLTKIGLPIGWGLIWDFFLPEAADLPALLSPGILLFGLSITGLAAVLLLSWLASLWATRAKPVHI